MTFKDNSAFLYLAQAPLTFISSAGVLKWCPNRRRLHRASTQRAAVTMLRVQDKRRPEDWDKKTSGLSGRFLPMDPRDEAVLDVLEKNTGGRNVEDSYGPEGPSSEAYGYSTIRSPPEKWNKRAEAARKRWADPVYRAKMLEKRAEKRRRDEEEKGNKLEIGCMDSITLSDEDKAKAINAYVRSNKLRSEKITAFHRNRKVWMEKRLDDSPQKLTDEEYVQNKLELRERRRQSALKRAEIRKNGGKQALPKTQQKKSRSQPKAKQQKKSAARKTESPITGVSDDTLVEQVE